MWINRMKMFANLYHVVAMEHIYISKIVIWPRVLVVTILVPGYIHALPFLPFHRHLIERMTRRRRDSIYMNPHACILTLLHVSDPYCSFRFIRNFKRKISWYNWTLLKWKIHRTVLPFPPSFLSSFFASTSPSEFLMDCKSRRYMWGGVFSFYWSKMLRNYRKGKKTIISICQKNIREFTARNMEGTWKG